MDRMLVVIFDSESKASDGKRALLQLDSEGSIGLWSYAVVAKNADCTATVEQDDDPGPLGTLAGTALGSLIGVLFGPAGAANGFASAFAPAATPCPVACPTPRWHDWHEWRPSYRDPPTAPSSPWAEPGLVGFGFSVAHRIEENSRQRIRSK